MDPRSTGRMDMRRSHSLRSLLAITTGAIAALALVAVGALVWLTTVMHRTTATAAAAVESVHLLEESEIELLLHARATDQDIARDLEVSLRDKLAAARAYVSSPAEVRALDKATSRVDAYFKRAREGGVPASELQALEGSAYAALEAVVALNLAEARAQHADAQRWDRISDTAALALGALLVATAALVIVWLRWRAFHPVLVLAEAMRRFGSG